MSVERLARALGAWPSWADNDGAVDGVELERRGWAINALHGDVGYRLWGPKAEDWDVDEGTALIFLLCLASGLRLDMGRCPACEERGGGWDEREFKVAVSSRFTPEEDRLRSDGWVFIGGTLSIDDNEATNIWRRPCPCSEPGEPVDCSGFMCHGGEVPTEFDYVEGAHGDRARVITRSHPCPDCKGSGKQPGPALPTGRRIAGAVAILDAAPRPYSDEERMLDVGTDPRRMIPLGGCGELVDSRVRPGDKATRDAIAVLGDQLQAKGDPLGVFVAAWLAGECTKCGGEPVRVPTSDPDSECYCPKCRGRGTVLGEIWPELEALADGLSAWLELEPQADGLGA